MSDLENPTPEPEVTNDDKLWALLSYLFTPLVPIIILFLEDKKQRPYIKAHYIQALVLGVALIILGTILSLIPIINIIMAFIWPIAWLVIVIVYGVKAYQGQMINIPVITNFVKSQKWA